MSENNSLPVPAGDLHGDLSLLTGSKSRVVTSLDLRTAEGSKKFRSARDGADLRGRDAVGQVLAVEDFILHTAARRRLDDGEIEDCLQLVLVCEDGRVFATTSSTCIRSFGEICSLTSYPPWRPARRLEVRRIKTSGGFETYKLVEAEEVSKNGK